MLFTTEIYQLNKNKETQTFQLRLKGEAEKNELTAKNISSFFASKIFKVYKAQNKIQSKTGKNRFFRLAKSKPLYFCFKSETLSFDTELDQSLIVKFVIGELTESQFRTALELVLDIMLDENKI